MSIIIEICCLSATAFRKITVISVKLHYSTQLWHDLFVLHGYLLSHTFSCAFSIRSLLLLLLLLLSRFSRVQLCATPEMAAHHPWDSPGKNTGVGCHFLLQCRKVKSESEVAQSCLTLHDPMDCSLPGSPVHGIFQARVLGWGAIAFSVNSNILDSSLIFYIKELEWPLKNTL